MTLMSDMMTSGMAASVFLTSRLWKKREVELQMRSQKVTCQLMRSRAVGIDKQQNGSAFIGQFYSPVVEHFQSVLRFRPAPSPAGGEALCRTFFQSVLRFAPSPAGGEASVRTSPSQVSSWSRAASYTSNWLYCESVQNRSIGRGETKNVTYLWLLQHTID